MYKTEPTSTELKSTAPAAITTNENTKGNTDTTERKSTAEAAVTTNEEEENYERQQEEKEVQLKSSL